MTSHATYSPDFRSVVHPRRRSRTSRLLAVLARYSPIVSQRAGRRSVKLCYLRWARAARSPEARNHWRALAEALDDATA